MWTLKLNDKKEKEYFDLLSPKLKGRISIYGLDNYLTESVIKELLIGKPEKLCHLAQSLIPEINNIEEINSLIKKVFDYDNLISGNKDISYGIANIIGVNTCVYCNRQYIFTVTKDKKGVVRPEFDHYFPKSKYPFLALSLYNLIPSCHICNSNCKGREELSENFNPYLNSGKGNFFKFSYVPDGQGIPNKIDIKDTNPKYEREIESFLGTFKLREIYNCHIPLEVKEIYTFATKYSDAYLQQLLNQLGENFNLSQEEAYRMLFGTELLEDKDNDRPLSKLKRDILTELGVISQNKS